MNVSHARTASAETRSVPAAPQKGVIYRSAVTGRLYSEADRRAAARALVAADKKRGKETDPAVVRLAERGRAA